MDAMGKPKIEVRCQQCRHVWTAVYLPMSLVKVSKVLRGLYCPNCGESAGGIYVHFDGKQAESE